MKINVYLVYLNSGETLRSSGNKVIFDNEIVGVGVRSIDTIYFTDSNFNSFDYPTSSVEGYNKRSFEPKIPGDKFNNKWNNSGSGEDWFKVYSDGTSNISCVFEVGCDNGNKGDFFRVITLA